MRKFTPILYITAFLLNTLLFGAFGKSSYQNYFNSKDYSYSPELSLMSYWSLDYDAAVFKEESSAMNLANVALLLEDDVEYCMPTYTNGCSGGAKVSNFVITNAILNISNNTGSSSCGTAGYNDFTSLTAAAPEGQEVSFAVTVGSYSGAVKLWVDWDNSGTFEDDDLIGASTSTISSGNTFTGAFTVPEGTALGDYRLRVRVVEGSTDFGACTSHSYGEAEDYTFSVIETPDCMPPTEVSAEPLTLTSVEFSWESDGDSFEVEWGAAGFTLGTGTTINNLTTTTTTVTTVVDTPYEFYVRRNCGADGFSYWSGPFGFETGYCMPVYTSGCSYGAKISKVETSDAILNISNTTGTSGCGAGGYNNFTEMVAEAPEETVVGIAITVGSYSGGVKFWIDWNNNGVFEDAELIDESPSTISSGATFTSGIQIPEGVGIGEYRMRIRVVESTTSFGACTSQSYGEAEDYTFSVIETPDCMPPIGVSAEPLTLTSVELSWESDGDSFEVEWGEAGFAVGEEEGTLIEDLTTTSTTVTTEIDVPYEFYVRRNCGSEDGDSFWVGPIAFQTGYCTPIYVYGCNSGSKVSKFETTGAILNISNNTGTTNCGVNGYNNFAEMAVAAPEDLEVTFAVTVGSYSGGVRVWIDWNGNGDFEEDELVGASTSTISSGSVFTTSFSVPEGTALGDYRIRVRVVESNTTFGPCTSQNYGETEDYTFSVIEAPACMLPSALGTGAMTFTSAELTWVSDGDLFDIEWGEEGFEQGEGTTITGVTANPYTLNNLDEETGYEYYVRRDCGSNSYSYWAGPYYFYTGYCLGTSQGSSYRIFGFSTTEGYINISNTNNGTTNGYNDYTNMAVVHSEGGSFNYAVTVPSYTNVEIWIDYNNNIAFDEDELIAEHTYVSNETTFTGTVILPTTIEEGDYRIRVRSRYYYNTVADPCGNASYGEIEDYTLTIIPTPSCLPPSGVSVLSVSEDSLTVGWTAVAGQDTWQVFVVPAGSPAPTETSTGFETTIENPYTVEGLDPNTEYEVYVRANCGDEDGLSLWAGPAKTLTTQIPADLPYEEGFEGSDEWSYSGTGDNQWVFGTAVNNGGTHALYVSKDEGDTHTYNTSSTTVAHAYRDFFVIDVDGELVIQFDWIAMGEGTSYKYDYLNVWILPSTHVLTPGVMIENTVNEGYKIVNNYNNNEEFLTEQILFGISALPEAYDSGYFRIVFEWRNDGSGGNQPPAAIDNIKLEVNECPGVLNIGYCEASDYISFYWEKRAQESGWEVALGTEDLAEPIEEDVVFVTEPESLFENLELETDYYFYLRTVCDEGVYGPWQKVKSKTTDLSVLEAEPFCAGPEGIIFPNVFGPGTVEERDTYGRVACLGNTPSAVWYFLKIENEGDLIFNIIQNTSFDNNGNPNGNTLDVDFVAFGPFGNLDEACKNIDLAPCPPGVNCPSGGNSYPIDELNIVDCNYSGSAIEQMRIYNAQVGEFYAILITNYNGDEGFIKLVQTNAEATDAGSTDCRFLCEVELGDDQIICEGAAYTIKAEISAAGSTEEMTYSWYKDGVLLDPEVYNTAVITVTESGIYKVLVEKDMCLENPTDEVEIKFVERFNKPIEDHISLCDLQNEGVLEFDLKGLGDNTIAQDEDVESLDYVFYRSLGDLENGVNAIDMSEPYLSAGGESVYLKITREGLVSCAVYKEVKLIIKPTLYPVAEFSYESPICVNNISGLNVIPVEGFTEGGVFSYSDGTLGVPTGLILDKKTGFIDVESSVPGKYSVTYTYSIPSDSCGEKKSHTTEITIFERFQISYEGDCYNGKYYLRVVDLLNNLDLNSSTYTWEGPGGFTDNRREIQVSRTGIYTVYFETKDGCYEELEIDLSEIDCMIQKGISPNGDGLNDFFDLGRYKVIKLSIFNRYGTEVYSHGIGYTNEWYGQGKSSNLLPDGTYFYEIQTLTEVLTGWIQINK